MAPAQTVRGVITEQTDSPIPGVVVQLLDSASVTVARGLSNERGEFRLAARLPGTYRLRALRIGFRPHTSQPAILRTGEEVNLRITLTGLPVSLRTVHVVGRSPCAAVSDSTAAIYLIWEQVRTALLAAQLTADARSLVMTTVGYERTLEADFSRIRDESARTRSEFVRQPWRSLPPDSLRRAGYVTADGADWTVYHAPGLDALAATEFLEDHCLGVTPSTDPTRVGIMFEPMPSRRRIAEIRGTLWVDRASAELRSLEFRYANVSAAQAEHAGGEMAFVRMDNGGWVISRWSIRMPVLAQRVSDQRVGRGAVAPLTYVAEIRTTGGVLLSVRQGRDTLWAHPRILVTGRVADSATGAPVQRARVILRGTRLEGLADSAGRFTIAGVLPGTYTLEVGTPSLDSLGAAHPSELVVTDSARSVLLRVPTGGQVVAGICGPRDAARPGGIVIGTLSMRGDPAPLADARVIAEWGEPTLREIPAGNAGAARIVVVGRRPYWREVRGDDRGTYRICGLPLNIPVVIRAQADGATSTPVELTIPDRRRLQRAELTLDQLGDRGAVFSGIVLGDSAQGPIVDAEVALPELGRSVLSNDAGGFRLSDIPPGTYQVIVRRIGYGPLDTRIDFLSSETIERRVFLTRMATLDSVVVLEERPVIPSFEDHRRAGLGRFLTRDDLARQEGRSTSAVLAQLSGLRVMVGRGQAAWIATSRGAQNIRAPDPHAYSQGARSACYADVYLDNLLVYSGKPGEPLFDINGISPERIEAIEYYAGPAQTPLKYSTLNSTCGVLVIHTRRDAESRVDSPMPQR